MKILTFDTSLNKTYVSFSVDGEITSSVVVENHNEKYHSAFLIPTIVSILKENNSVMQDVDVIATNVGPGSFTGIRACVSVARVIAQQLDCPLVGISSLEILSKINKTDKKTILVLDARKNQYYTAVYENGKEVQKPALTNADDVFKLDFSNSVVISDEASSKFLAEKDIKTVIFTETNDNFADYLNKIAFDRVKNSENPHDEYAWGKLKPLYLQVPPVTISAKNLQ